MYTVQKGNTLSDIAKAYNVSVQELLAANPNIRNKNMIRIGLQINIPVTKGSLNATLRFGEIPESSRHIKPEYIEQLDPNYLAASTEIAGPDTGTYTVHPEVATHTFVRPAPTPIPSSKMRLSAYPDYVEQTNPEDYKWYTFPMTSMSAGMPVLHAVNRE